MVARLAVSNKQIVECFNIKIVKLFWLGFWRKRTKVHLIRIYSNTFFLKEWVLRQLAKSCKNASSGLWLNPKIETMSDEEDYSSSDDEDYVPSGELF